VGGYLQASGFFEGAPKQVQVIRLSSGALRVRFFLIEGAWTNPGTRSAFQSVRDSLAADPAVGDPGLEVELCDTSAKGRIVLRKG
jgi:hypothetical protein